MQDVPDLGEKGHLANVAKGYARNYLMPRGLAEVGDAGQDRRVPAPRRRAQGARGAHRPSRPRRSPATLNRTVLTLAARAGEGDRLFGSVTSADIADAIQDARGYAIDKRKVLLDEPIKELGTFMVDVEVADGFVASVKTIVVPE